MATRTNTSTESAHEEETPRFNLKTLHLVNKTGMGRILRLTVNHFAFQQGLG
jgi:hypothetical protein